MTTVEIYRRNGRVVRYRAYGHSEYDEMYRDIVCASVSVILQSPLGGMQDVLNVYPKFKIEKEGHIDVDISFMDDKDKKKEIDTLLETMVVMLKELEKGYPKNIKLVEKEVK